MRFDERLVTPPIHDLLRLRSRSLIRQGLIGDTTQSVPGALHVIDTMLSSFA